MALDSWLAKVKSAISAARRTAMASDVSRRRHVGILAFEIASLMSKLLHLWRSLSDAQISLLRRESIAASAVRKVVSDDDDFLLSLACAEITDALSHVARSASVLAARCAEPDLARFGERFAAAASDGGGTGERSAMSWKEMEARARRMDRHVATTADLYKEMEELSEAEQTLRKLLKCSGDGAAVEIQQQRIFWKLQRVRYLKQISLWNFTFDQATAILARSAFAVLARIKLVFGIEQQRRLPSSAIHPSADAPPPDPSKIGIGLLESSAAMLVPPETTLGAAGLALHYADLIAAVERAARSPARSVGAEVRGEVYGMLPASVRGRLRERLRGVGWAAATDAGLAAEWAAAMGGIAGWIFPLARNTVRWHGDRIFERRGAAAAVAPRGGVMVFETLVFANREKVEAALAELLVGLNYMWRFEMANLLSNYLKTPSN